MLRRDQENLRSDQEEQYRSLRSLREQMQRELREHVTRPSRDGGRDGIGKYRVGLPQNCVTVDFALEAKCYALDRCVGVKAASRLISRLRHRQFGILVTTSYLAEQAYTEVVEDGHPIIICSGGDIAELMVVKRGFQSAKEASVWLTAAYPLMMKEGDLEPAAGK
jgi:hypothetical protein